MPEYVLQISETLHKHQKRYSLELHDALEDYKRTLALPITTNYAAQQHEAKSRVEVLEARMDTLRDLDEDIQKIVKKALGS